MTHVGNRLAVEAEDHIARLNAAGLGRAVVVDAGDERAVRLVQPEALGNFVGDRLDAHAEPAAVHGMIGLPDQRGRDRLGKVGGDRETDADRPAAGRIDRRGDADDLAIHVEHRPAGVAPVDRGVGLQEVVVGSRIDVALPRRKNAGGDAAAEAERVADRQHQIADPRHVAVAPAGGNQLLVGLYLQDRDIGLAVAADQFGLEVGVVMQDDGDLVGIGNDVIVGDDVAGRVDHEARAERGRLARLGLGAIAALAVMVEEILEELLERRAGRELRPARGGALGLALRLHGLCRRNIDDGRQQLLGKISKPFRRRTRRRGG